MYTYHFQEWLTFFYFYCVFGWCFESTYVSLKEHRPVNRGFLHGPWLPLYGTGAITVLWLTLPFQAYPALVYVVGALGATVLEYVTGEAMVRIFRVRYWDYSNQRFQYKGHICLSSSIAWGFLSLLMVYAVHEPVADLVMRIPGGILHVLTFIVTVCMACDTGAAFRRAMDLRELLIQAEQLREEMERRAAEHLEERLEQLRERMSRTAEHLLAQSPRARFMTLFDDTNEIRERIRRRRKKEK